MFPGVGRLCLCGSLAAKQRCSWMLKDDKSLNRQSIEQFATPLDLTTPSLFSLLFSLLLVLLIKVRARQIRTIYNTTQHYTPYNLQLHRLSLHVDGPDLEVDSDGGDIALCVRVILVGRSNEPVVNSELQDSGSIKGTQTEVCWVAYRKAQQQTGLPDSWVANQEHFEQIVAGEQTRVHWVKHYCTTTTYMYTLSL